jgi:hypothetical protein
VQPLFNQTQVTPAQQPPNYRRLSIQLKQGMSEQDVTNLMGQANGSSLSSCGQNVGKPWTCKIWTYGFGNGPLGTALAVIFGQDQSTGAWVVFGAGPSLMGGLPSVARCAHALTTHFHVKA